MKQFIVRITTIVQTLVEVEEAQEQATEEQVSPRDVIELAIKDEQNLDILYAKPDEDVPKWRIVEPWEIEERPNGDCLLAYDQSSDGPRRFRLDRIKNIRFMSAVRL